MGNVLDTIARIISPVADIAGKWQFWIVLGAVILFALIAFILFPALKFALIWAGRLVGTFMRGG